MHVLGAIAEFEKDRIRERVLAGLERARRQGKRHAMQNSEAVYDIIAVRDLHFGQLEQDITVVAGDEEFELTVIARRKSLEAALRLSGVVTRDSAPGSA